MSENPVDGLIQTVKDKASEVAQKATPAGQTAGSAVRNDADDAAQKGSDIDAGDVDEGLIDRQG